MCKDRLSDIYKITTIAETVKTKNTEIKEAQKALQNLKIEGLEAILETLGFKDKVVETLKEQTPKKGVLRVAIIDNNPDICFYKLKSNGEVSLKQTYVNGVYGSMFWYLDPKNIESILAGLKESFRVVPEKELAHKTKPIERD